MRKKAAIGAGVLLLLVAVVWWFSPRSTGPADSSWPQYTTIESRIDWIGGRIRGRVPSAIQDVQFRQWENHIPGGHMGPAYTMRFLRAKISILPVDAPKWVSRTRPKQAGYYDGTTANPRDEMTTADSAGARFYDPEPLFGSDDGGFMAITADNKHVFVSIRY